MVVLVDVSIYAPDVEEPMKSRIKTVIRNKEKKEGDDCIHEAQLSHAPANVRGMSPAESHQVVSEGTGHNLVESDESEVRLVPVLQKT